MGVSIEVYRARIGQFHPRKFSSSLRCNKGGNMRLSFTCIPVAALLIMLMISGVEPNPGPEAFLCKFCKVECKTCSAYCEHLKIHSLWKNFSIPCHINDCKRVFKSASSYESHVSRFHREERSRAVVPPISVSCAIPTCEQNFNSRTDFMEHMKIHLSKNASFTCGLEGGSGKCKSKITGVRQHQVHMSRYHKTLNVGVSSASGATVSECPHERSFHEDSDDEGNCDQDIFYDCDPTHDCDDESSVCDDLYPEEVIKDDVARFYLKLEGEFLLPTSTVQQISLEIKRITEFSHHCLKKALRQQLSPLGLSDQVIDAILLGTFQNDPVFNVHHKGEDIEHLATAFLRHKYWHKRFPFVEPEPVYFGTNEAGKKRVAHYVPIKQTLEVLLRDDKIKAMVQDSFQREENDTSILKDFTDGQAYKSHKCHHDDGQCLQLLLFQDAFDFHAFGPTTGLYKPIGFYYSLGNIPSEYRSKLDLIQLTYMLLEKDTQPTMAEELADRDILKEALKPLLDELEDLKVNGIEIDGKQIPVCLLNLLGDSLGQHSMGGFVKSFSAQFFCRFCCMSKDQFHERPYDVLPLRNPEEYDNYVLKADALYKKRRQEALEAHRKTQLRKAMQQAGRVSSRLSASRILMKSMVSKSALKKLRAVNYRGVKYRPSPFNAKPLKFHVSSPAMPPCLAHDLFEGILKCVLANILSYFINEKQWFTFVTLNRRIKQFKCKGSDALDAPQPLKKINELSGNAVQNWNLLRLLPFLISDLIQDQNDPVWKLYLLLKQICEYVCAPQISLSQVAFLRSLIGLYLSNLKDLAEFFPKCMIPKQHFLCHYPDLIMIFGPLIRLCTLRYESKHVFFKRVARTCKNYINITYTLAKKYVCRFAYDHSTGLLPPDIIYDPSNSLVYTASTISNEQAEALPHDFDFGKAEFLKKIVIKGIGYETVFYLVLDSVEGSTDLIVGRIDCIILNTDNEAIFLLEEKQAIHSFNGYFTVEPSSVKKFRYQLYDNLLDYYPLQSYVFAGNECIILKHSVVCM